MRSRGDLVRITTGQYAGHQLTVESSVYQRTVDSRTSSPTGTTVMLDNEVLVTVRWG